MKAEVTVYCEKSANGLDLSAVKAILLQNPKHGFYQIRIATLPDEKKRSPDQNRYLFGVAYPILMLALNNAGYQFQTVNKVHKYMLSCANQMRIVDPLSGMIITFPESTRKMSVTVMNAYINYVHYVSEFLEVKL